MSFGSRLRRLRIAAGLTQAELAEGIAASSYMSLLEADKRIPKPEISHQLALRLGVPLEELISDPNELEISLNLNMAEVALSAGEFEQAENYANQVLAISRMATSAALSAQVVVLRVKVRKGLFNGVIDELEHLLRAHPNADPTIQARIGNEIIHACFQSGNLGLGAQRGEELVREVAGRWPQTEFVALLCKLASCHFHRGDTARACEMTDRALELAKELQDPKAMMESEWYSAHADRLRGDLAQAEQHITQAASWSKIAELKVMQPVISSDAALFMLDAPNPDFERIHNLAEAAYLDFMAQNFPGLAAGACKTLSEVALRQGKYVEALEYARTGLAVLPQGLTWPQSGLYCQELKILAKMGKLQESELLVARTISHMEQMAPSRELAEYWRELARAFVEIGQSERANYAYEKAFSASTVPRYSAETEASNAHHS